MSECYVTSIQWNSKTEVEINRALVRGSLVTKGNRNGRFGVLSVAEVWPASDNRPIGEFFRVRDPSALYSGACPTHHEENPAPLPEISLVDLTNWCNQELRAMIGGHTSPGWVVDPYSGN
jgi:hypothetical protein